MASLTPCFCSQEEDGGALELYPQEAKNTPAIRPSAKVLPHANTMALFEVLPGRSFHSVQETFTDERPRASIQGWFHAPVPGEVLGEGVAFYAPVCC